MQWPLSSSGGTGGVMPFISLNTLCSVWQQASKSRVTCHEALAQNISEIMARKYFTMSIIYSLDISGDSWDIS